MQTSGTLLGISRLDFKLLAGANYGGANVSAHVQRDRPLSPIAAFRKRRVPS